tara:strand:- start:945 stop:1469 length:525 start_codon:yes stop_codon:yes gene_type:complete
MSITSWTNEGNGATVTAGNDLSCKSLTTTGTINSGSNQIMTSGLITCGSIAASALVNALGDLYVEGVTALKGNVTIGNATTDTVGFFGTTPVAGNAAGSSITQTYSAINSTVVASTFTSKGDLGATQNTGWGASSEANFDKITTGLDQLNADLVALKGNVNYIIDRLQALGLMT